MDGLSDPKFKKVVCCRPNLDPEPGAKVKAQIVSC